MKRAYLEEDLELIRRHFPGAKAVALRTPFDLTPRDTRLPRTADSLQGRSRRNRKGGVLWMS